MSSLVAAPRINSSLISVQASLKSMTIAGLLDHRRRRKLTEWQTWKSAHKIDDDDQDLPPKPPKTQLFNNVSQSASGVQGQGHSVSIGDSKTSPSDYQSGANEFSDVTIDNVLDCNLISVPDTASLAQVMSVLHNHGFIAVAVHSTRPDEYANLSTRYKGTVSIFDVLSHTIFRDLFDHISANEQSANQDQFLRDCIDQIIEDQTTLVNSKVGDIISFNPSQQHILKPSDTLYDLLQQTIDASYHRVIVNSNDISDQRVFSRIDSSEDLRDQGQFTRSAHRIDKDCSLVTQMDILRYLSDEGHQSLGPAFECLLETQCQDAEKLAFRFLQERKLHTESGTSKSKHYFCNDRYSRDSGVECEFRVITVSDSSTALDAFRIMYKHEIHAVAVVDEDGGLAANLSASDLRGILMSNLPCLLDNVFDFLETDIYRKPAQIKADQLKAVAGSAGLRQAMQLMLDSHIHHVWIIGEQDKPVGIVTSADILTLFALDAIDAREP